MRRRCRCRPAETESGESKGVKRRNLFDFQRGNDRRQRAVIFEDKETNYIFESCHNIHSNGLTLFCLRVHHHIADAVARRGVEEVCRGDCRDGIRDMCLLPCDDFNSITSSEIFASTLHFSIEGFNLQAFPAVQCT